MSAWPNGAPRVGDTASMSRTIGADDIVRFTELSGDRNPLHYDAVLAGGTRFGEIVVQGGVTSAILNAVVAEKLPGPGTVFLETDRGDRCLLDDGPRRLTRPPATVRRGDPNPCGAPA